MVSCRIFAAPLNVTSTTFLLLLHLICVNADNVTSNNLRISSHDSNIQSKKHESILQLTLKLAEVHGMEEAAEYVNKLQYNHDRFMELYIKKLYNENPGDFMQAIHLFQQLNCTEYGKWAQTLFKEIEKQNHFSHSKILTFESFLHKCFDKEEAVKDTAALLRPHTDKILNGFAADIQAGNYGNLVYSHFWNYGVSLRLPYLIKKALARDTAHFSQTLKFVAGMRYLKLQATGYSTLVQELKEMDLEHSEEMLALSYWMHDAMAKGKDELDSNLNLQMNFDKVKQDIPGAIRNICWSSKTCTIKSFHWNEFLYATKKVDEADGNGAVFTWLTGEKPATSLWSLEPTESDDGKLHFQINNVKLSSSGGKEETYSLCEAATSYNVVTCDGMQTSRKYHLWVLQPATWNGSELFILRNVQSKAYHIHATAEHNLSLKRRTVRNKSSLEDTSYWEIACS